MQWLWWLLRSCCVILYIGRQIVLSIIIIFKTMILSVLVWEVLQYLIISYWHNVAAGKPLPSRNSLHSNHEQTKANIINKRQEDSFMHIASSTSQVNLA